MSVFLWWGALALAPAAAAAAHASACVTANAVVTAAALVAAITGDIVAHTVTASAALAVAA